MPVYDYLCVRCGPFTDLRPMADCERPHRCPKCGTEAPRAYLTAPYCAAMPAERRLAHATNERSANAPQRLSDIKADMRAHGSGCGCGCGKSVHSAKSSSLGKSNSVRSFPARRPWMISH